MPRFYIRVPLLLSLSLLGLPRNAAERGRHESDDFKHEQAVGAALPAPSDSSMPCSYVICPYLIHHQSKDDLFTTYSDKLEGKLIRLLGDSSRERVKTSPKGRYDAPSDYRTERGVFDIVSVTEETASPDNMNATYRIESVSTASGHPPVVSVVIPCHIPRGPGGEEWCRDIIIAQVAQVITGHDNNYHKRR